MRRGLKWLAPSGSDSHLLLSLGFPSSTEGGRPAPGFPEAGGEGCQPQGQEERMPLEGCGGRLALGWPRTPACSKAACEPEPALQARGQDPARAQLRQEPLSHGCHPTHRPPRARTEPSYPEARTGAGPCPGTPPESDIATKCKPATRACSHRGAPKGTPDRAAPGGWSHEALPSRWRNHGRPCVIMAVTSCGAGSSPPPQGPGSAPRGLGARAGPGQSVGQTQSWGGGQPGPPP